MPSWVQPDQIGILRLHDAERLPRVPGQNRRIARFGESVADVPQSLRVVVHRKNAHPLSHTSPRGASRERWRNSRSDAPGRFDRKDGEVEPRSHARLLVGDRDRPIKVLAHCGHPYGGCRRGVPGLVGQQVAADLNDTAPVHLHQGLVWFDVDGEIFPAPCADEGAPCLLHQHCDLCRLGTDRQYALLDAYHVEKVGNQVMNVVGLFIDDAEELTDYCGVKVGGRTQHGGGGAPDAAAVELRVTPNHLFVVEAERKRWTPELRALATGVLSAG